VYTYVLKKSSGIKGINLHEIPNTANGRKITKVNVYNKGPLSFQEDTSIFTYACESNTEQLLITNNRQYKPGNIEV
jgi:hypothetical protein